MTSTSTDDGDDSRIDNINDSFTVLPHTNLESCVLLCWSVN